MLISKMKYFTPTPSLVGKLDIFDEHGTTLSLKSSYMLEVEGSLVEAKKRYLDGEPVFIKVKASNGDYNECGLSIKQLQDLQKTTTDMLTYLMMEGEK